MQNKQNEPITIALAGNPNSGKTTLFNALTGSNQYVGNWPGVTVEKKEGRLKTDKTITITDLPGIYSLSPYTLEEVIARNYLLDNHPDVILNIVDGTNLERNLYLTTQLIELGIPVVVAVNMMDVVDKTGDKINTDVLSKKLGCAVVTISAMKNLNTDKAVALAIEVARSKTTASDSTQVYFSAQVEQAIAQIGDLLTGVLPAEKRFFAIKLFERDEKILEKGKFPNVEEIVSEVETQMDDDAESIITNERYTYISSIIESCLKRKNRAALTVSDKIDRVVTNRWAALPIFAAVMVLIYYISVTTVGGLLTDWMNDGIFGDGWHLFGIGAGEYETAMEDFEAMAEESALSEEELAALEPDPAEYGVWVPGLPVLAEDALAALDTADWLNGLILEGIIGGVGAVLGFVPQILVLFIFLAFLEGCGYMARIAFILDRVFRKFGLSGKSFIPMLIGTGCGVPGIMASRTIENERDRRMTIMTTTFIPCGAKLPIIGLIAGALFGGAWWVAPSAYFIGIGAIIVSGIILKKTKAFTGDVAPFVMELPSYHLPRFGYVMRSMWERGWSFIKKAGTIILLSAIAIWFTSNFGFVDGQFGMVEDLSDGLLATIGNAIAWVFAPLGFGNWQAAVATIMGLVAKENVVGTFGVLYGYAEVAEEGNEIWTMLAADFTTISAYAFLVFNLLCAPCFAAIGAIRREMNNWKWTLFAIGYQTGFAYIIALIVNQLGMLFTGGGFGFGTIVAIVFVALLVFLLFRPTKTNRKKLVGSAA